MHRACSQQTAFIYITLSLTHNNFTLMSIALNISYLRLRISPSIRLCIYFIPSHLFATMPASITTCTCFASYHITNVKPVWSKDSVRAKHQLMMMLIPNHPRRIENAEDMANSKGDEVETNMFKRWPSILSS